MTKQNGKQDKPSKGRAKGGRHHGHLLGVAFAPDVLTLREQGRNVALPVSVHVLVVIDKKKADLADLAAGMDVFANTDSAGTVVSIDAKSEEGGAGEEAAG